MNELIPLILITLLAVISPGADFAIVTRNSYLYGRSHGLACACGIALGVWIHVMYASVLIHFAMRALPQLLQFLTLAGAMYLIYIGYQTIRQPLIQTHDPHVVVSIRASFYNGVLTNALNPKTALFVISLMTQLISMQITVWGLIGFGSFVSLAHLLWFFAVADLIFTPKLRDRILAQQRLLNRLIGGVLIALGGMLLLNLGRS